MIHSYLAKVILNKSVVDLVSRTSFVLCIESLFYSSTTSHGLIFVSDLEFIRFVEPNGWLGLNCSPSSKLRPVFLIASMNIFILSFSITFSSTSSLTWDIPVSKHRWPRTFPTIFTAERSVFEYKNLAIAHSFVEAEQTVLPVQCVTDAEVCWPDMANWRAFQYLRVPLSVEKPVGL